MARGRSLVTGDWVMPGGSRSALDTRSGRAALFWDRGVGARAAAELASCALLRDNEPAIQINFIALLRARDTRGDWIRSTLCAERWMTGSTCGWQLSKVIWGSLSPLRRESMSFELVGVKRRTSNHFEFKWYYRWFLTLWVILCSISVQEFCSIFIYLQC